MDFSFLTAEVEKFPRILDNIGVINLYAGEKLVDRLGTLVTK